MPALKEGILINQPAPRLYRANRRPLYIAIGALIAVFVLLAWAWTVRSNMKSIAQAKAVANAAAPATSAIKTLDKQWMDKLPKQPEQINVAPNNPAAQLVEGTAPLQPLRPPAIQANPTNSQAIPPIASYSQIPQITPRQPVQMDAEDEQRAAWDSPMVPNRQVSPQQEPQMSPQIPVAAVPPMPSASYVPTRNGERSPGDDYLSQNLQDSKKAFAGVGRNTLMPIVPDGDRLSPYVVKAGWDIPAILEQAANSDLPGELRARVRENVYDTATGRYLLIPQNSILVGKYNSDIAYAQNRVQVNWDRLLRPGNEPTIFLNQMNGVDGDGSAGLTGQVNNHYKRLIGFALLTSAFAAGIEVSQTHNNASPYGYPTAGQMAGTAVGTQMGEFGRRITERNLNRPPTIQLKPGTRFNVRVDRDIVFTAPFH
jgi:type IV secretory pathway VirB10-like protein